MTTQITTFNTGRQYSDKGQRIACALLPDGRVMFADVDRNLDGITQGAIAPGLQAGADLREFVMNSYDYGAYNSGCHECTSGQAARDQMMAELKAAALKL
jgi:hypothetical protein